MTTDPQKTRPDLRPALDRAAVEETRRSLAEEAAAADEAPTPAEAEGRDPVADAADAAFVPRPTI